MLYIYNTMYVKKCTKIGYYFSLKSAFEYIENNY